MFEVLGIRFQVTGPNLSTLFVRARARARGLRADT